MPSTLYNPDGSRTGLRINAAVRRKRYMGGGDQGPLSTRPTGNEAWEAHERARARSDAAAASAPAAEKRLTPPAPAERQVKLLGAQPEGQLVPGPSGSAVWKTKDQITAEQEMRASRAAARRKGVNMTPALSPKAAPQFTFPKLEGGRPRVATFERFKI